ncbi:MAG: flagellin, partial [Candidatus Hydrogenedentales bacterium]
TNLLESARTRHEELQLNLKVLRSDMEDIDIADAILELNKQENTYQATLGAAAKIIQPSLLDFLR